MIPVIVVGCLLVGYLIGYAAARIDAKHKRDLG